VRKNGCGNCGVSGPVDRNCLHELVVGTSLSLSKLSLTLIRDIRTCILIYLTQNIILLQNMPTQSHDCNWRKTETVSEWVVPLLQSNCSKNRGSWPVCLFVTWDPSILHQAVYNLEAKSEPDQLTNSCAGHRLRKRRNAWPVNNAWDRNHAFLHGLMPRC
jgi:hypothetical protein